MRHNQKQLIPITDVGIFERTDVPMSGHPKIGQPQSRLEEQIDDNLRRVYQSTLDDPIPDRFLMLISELRNKIADKGPDRQDDVKRDLPE